MELSYDVDAAIAGKGVAIHFDTAAGPLGCVEVPGASRGAPRPEASADRAAGGAAARASRRTALPARLLLMPARRCPCAGYAFPDGFQAKFSKKQAKYSFK